MPVAPAVRHVDPDQVRTVDLLDAARRLVVLDSRHLDRVTDSGHLASTAQMRANALEVTGGDRSRADRLVAMTALVAAECTQQARPDLGIGAVHLPEAQVLGLSAADDPMAVLAQRCRDGVARRYPGAGEAERQVVLDRLDEELAVIETLGYPTYFLTVAEVTDLIRAKRGAGGRPRLGRRQPGQLPAGHQRGRPDPPPTCSWSGSARRCAPNCPTSTSTSSRPGAPRSTRRSSTRFGGERVTCVSMMDTYKVRHAVRDVGAALGLPPAEVDEIAKAFPHIRAKDARHAIADLPELRSRGLDSPRWRPSSTSSRPSTGCPATSRCTPAGSSCPTRACSTAPRSRRAGWGSR
jgi:error-prone DNA polymerase